MSGPANRGPTRVVLRLGDPVPGAPVGGGGGVDARCVLAYQPDGACDGAAGRDRVGAGAGVVAPAACVVGAGTVESGVVARRVADEDGC